MARKPNDKAFKASIAHCARVVVSFISFLANAYLSNASNIFYKIVRKIKNSPSRTPIHFLQESCRSGTFQTLSARILQESWISDKPVRFLQIKHFLQIETFLARFLQVKTFRARFLDGSCKTMSET